MLLTERLSEDCSAGRGGRPAVACGWPTSRASGYLCGGNRRKRRRCFGAVDSPPPPSWRVVVRGRLPAAVIGIKCILLMPRAGRAEGKAGR